MLKAYGATTEGVDCAAFGFDPESFAPTYRLVYGSTGRSLALEIAGRLGLDRQIIETATALRSAREAQLADHLARVDDDRRQLDELRRRLDEQQSGLVERATRLKERETAFERREHAHRQDLGQSLDTRLRTAREEIDEVVDTLRRRAATLERTATARTSTRQRPLSTGDSGTLRGEARHALEDIARGFPTPTTPPPAPTRDCFPAIQRKPARSRVPAI